MPETVPVNVGEAKFALRSRAVCWAVETGLAVSAVLSTLPRPTLDFVRSVTCDAVIAIAELPAAVKRPWASTVKVATVPAAPYDPAVTAVDAKLRVTEPEDPPPVKPVPAVTEEMSPTSIGVLTQAVPFHLRKSPFMAEVIVTSPISSRLLIVGIEAHSMPAAAEELAFKK